jgi:hypothetical protein
MSNPNPNETPANSEPAEKTRKKRQPLKVRCTQTECEQGLHYFRVKRRSGDENPAGPCQVCGEELGDWDILHSRDPANEADVFRLLQREFVRHHYWHVEIDEKAMSKARRAGRTTMAELVQERLRKSVAADPKNMKRWDGMQTPREGDVIYYAQHATASCCRKCIERWHGIPPKGHLTDEQFEYLGGLVRRYIDVRIPDLAEEGIEPG